MPQAPINTLNCLILESKNQLKVIPPHFHTYFINSKRRFFLYFRYHKQMVEAMRLLNENGLRFYQRESLLQDRQEQEEAVFHCNYKYKRTDLRRTLLHSTPYNQPRLYFDKYESAKSKYQNTQKRDQSQISLPVQAESEKKSEQKHEPQQPKSQLYNGYRLKNEQVRAILQNKELIRQILQSFNTEEE